MAPQRRAASPRVSEALGLEISLVHTGDNQDRGLSPFVLLEMLILLIALLHVSDAYFAYDGPSWPA